MYSLHFGYSEEGMKLFEVLGSIIQILAMNTSDEDFFLMNIRQDHVLKDTLQSVSRKCFSCRFSLKVRHACMYYSGTQLTQNLRDQLETFMLTEFHVNRTFISII